MLRELISALSRWEVFPALFVTTFNRLKCGPLAAGAWASVASNTVSIAELMEEREAFSGRRILRMRLLVYSVCHLVKQ